MATNRTSEHLRYRYGICLNDNCQKSKNKDVQQIPARKDFVCEECGKALRECPPPKTGPNKMLIGTIAAVVVIGAGAGLFFGLSGGDNQEPAPVAADSIDIKKDSVAPILTPDTVVVEKLDTIVKTDTVVQMNTVVVKEEVPVKVAPPAQTQSQPSASAKSNGKVRLSYGSYSGDTKNGYPDGMGRLTYTTTRVINKYDSKGRTANAGDYVIGEFVNGFFVQGKHYSSDGTLVETLMVGAPPTGTSESK